MSTSIGDILEQKMGVEIAKNQIRETLEKKEFGERIVETIEYGIRAHVPKGIMSQGMNMLLEAALVVSTEEVRKEISGLKEENERLRNLVDMLTDGVGK